jgi:hypothetical protein
MQICLLSAEPSFGLSEFPALNRVAQEGGTLRLSRKSVILSIATDGAGYFYPCRLIVG